MLAMSYVNIERPDITRHRGDVCKGKQESILSSKYFAWENAWMVFSFIRIGVWTRGRASSFQNTIMDYF